jgi:hypothetical protein
MDNSTFITGMNRAIGFARFYSLNLDIKTLPFIQLADSKTTNDLPPIACVYFIINSDGKVFYIGKAINLFNRWQRHNHKKRALNDSSLSLAWLELAPQDLTIIEALMIQRFSPEWNIADLRKQGDEFFRSDPKRFSGIWSK